MHRALTQGFGTGTSLALWLNLLNGLDNPGPILPYDLACPAASWLELHWPSLVFGVVLVLLLGPLLEALVSLRLLLFQAALRRGALLGPTSPPRPLYRVQ